MFIYFLTTESLMRTQGNLDSKISEERRHFIKHALKLGGGFLLTAGYVGFILNSLFGRKIYHLSLTVTNPLNKSKYTYFCNGKAVVSSPESGHSAILIFSERQFNQYFDYIKHKYSELNPDSINLNIKCYHWDELSPVGDSEVYELVEIVDISFEK